jgi:integrase
MRISSYTLYSPIEYAIEYGDIRRYFMPRTRKDNTACPDVTVVTNDRRLRLSISKLLYEDRKQRYISLLLDDNPNNRLAATLRQVELQGEINNGTFDPTLAKYQVWKEQSGKGTYRSDGGITLGELWEYWSRYQQPLLAPSTYNQKFLMTYKNAISAIGRDKLVCPSTAKYALEWLIANRNKHDNVILLGHLERATNQLISEGRIKSTNPFTGMSKKLFSSRNKIIDNRPVEEVLQSMNGRVGYTASERDEILNVFKEAFPHYWLFTYFRFYTGCRFEESIGIEWQDITEDCSKIVFRRTYSEVGKSVKVTKMGRARRFNCPPKLQLLLQDHRKKNCQSPNAPIFLSQSGTRVALGYYKKIWNKTIDSLHDDGLIEVKLSPRHTRHTLSNLAEAQGIDVDDITKQMGHSPKVRDKHYKNRIQSSEVMLVD